MKRESTGRSATFGLVVVLVSLLVGAGLYIASLRRVSDAVADFARAPVGCTTTLEFVERGTFYVYEERSGVAEVPAGCAPKAAPGRAFDVAFVGDRVPDAERRGAAGPSYDIDGFDGRTFSEIVIVEPGEYIVEVAGEDVAVVAAIGADPNDGVRTLRWGALAVVIAGLAIGLALLGRARRGKSTDTPDGDRTGAPADAGWAPPAIHPVAPSAGNWPPRAPNIDDIAAAPPDSAPADDAWRPQEN